MRTLIATFAMLMIVLTGSAIAERIALEEPLKIAAQKSDRTLLRGELIAYGESGFELRGKDGEVQRVGWDQFDARHVYLLHMRVFGSEATGEQWFDLGRRLLGFRGGEPWADRAFFQAIQLDEDFADRVEQAKTDAKDDRAQPKQTKAASSTGSAAAAAEKIEQKVWGMLDEEQSARAVEELKAFAVEAARKLGNTELRLYETRRFLLCTDLDAAEAAKWQGLLDKMYRRLLEVFDIPERTNVWHGKALVFVFESREDFLQYETEVEGSHDVPATTVGRCHVHGPKVRIAFYRQPDEMLFATVLVHEAVHGFLSRYRAPGFPAPWINEGLSEWIAYDLVPKSTWKFARVASATRELRTRGDFGGMFDDWSAGWHYGAAYMLTDFMIDYSRARGLLGEGKGYVGLINATKDKVPWEEAFEKNMGMSLERFVGGFGRANDIPGLRP